VYSRRRRRNREIREKLVNNWDDTWQTNAEGLPLCPKHGAAMPKMFGLGHMHGVPVEETDEETGEVFTADYICRGKPGNDSPGWDR
jgi:hypothetical protein